MGGDKSLKIRNKADNYFGVGNNFQKQTPSALKAKAQNAYTVINGASDPGYGVPNATLTGLNTNQTALGTAIQAVENARAALEAAVQTRDAAYLATAESLSSIGLVIYANPEVTDAMISAAGYAVRDKVPTPVVPVTPNKVVASPSATGTVELKWDRNGGRYGITYQVEGRAEGSSTWTVLASTTRQSITLNGFTPGVGYWFRVVPTKNTSSAAPSEPVSIYVGTESPSLQIAA